MNEEKKDLFAGMFGGQKNEGAPAAETQAAEPVAEKDDDADGTYERPDLEAERIETEEKCEAKPEADEGCDPKALSEAKKELGMGGAAFCDEVYANFPDVFSRLREQKKTMHGLFNFAYSYALNEYAKRYGHKNGGGYWSLREIAEKYLDPKVKEGFTVEEPKAKTEPQKTKTPSETVVKIAKKAAKAAKKAAEKKEALKASAEAAASAKADESAVQAPAAAEPQKPAVLSKNNPFLGLNFNF